MKSIFLAIILTITLSLISPVFADTEQSNDIAYLGISEDVIKSFFGDDGINTEAEHANAVLVNDLYLRHGHNDLQK